MVTFLSVFLKLNAQEFILHGETGIGTYSMTDLSTNQKLFLHYNPVRDIKILDNFPPYYYENLELSVLIVPQVGFGIFSGFHSTGSRAYYSDYSGYYYRDLNVSSIMYGTKFIYRFYEKNKFYVVLNFKIGSERSFVQLDNVISLSEYSSKSTRKFESISNFIEPQIQFEKLFFEKLYLGIVVGYELDIGGEIGSVDDASGNLFANNDKIANINWTGFRAGISVGYRLFGRL